MNSYDMGFGIRVDVWDTEFGREAKIENSEVENDG